MAPRARLAGGQAGRVREEDLTGKKMAEKKIKNGEKGKNADRWPLMAYLGNMLFYNFRKHEFGSSVN
jgi:hypothetical protein